MLYLIAHSVLNSQSKKFKFFSVTRATRDAIKKKKVELWGQECQSSVTMRRMLSTAGISASFNIFLIGSPAKNSSGR